MIEWIDTKLLKIFDNFCTKNESKLIALWVFISILYLCKETDNSIWCAITASILVCLFENVFMNFVQNKKYLNELKNLSLEEKELIKRYIDEDRKILSLRSPNSDLEKLKEKKIIKLKPIDAFTTDGIKREEDNWDEYIIDDLYFKIAKKNYTKIFG